MHSTRMRTVRSLSNERVSDQEGGSLSSGVSVREVPRPRTETLSPPSVNRMTDASKNITLLQTSFADGNKEGTRILKLIWKFLFKDSERVVDFPLVFYYRLFSEHFRIGWRIK